MLNTEKEIMRIPELLKTKKSFNFEKGKKYLFVGCGSSYNIGLITTGMLKNNGIFAEVLTSGNVLLSNYEYDFDEVILITRTGTTTETVNAAKKLNQMGLKTVGITCAQDSPIVKETKEHYVFDFANEESVVMTGSFVYILNFLFNGIKEYDLVNDSITVLEETKKYLDKVDLSKYNHFVFLGFAENYGISKEGSLKLQEMAIQRVEFHEPLEYRHGPKSTVNNGTLIIYNSKNTEAEDKLVSELEGLGAKVIMVGNNKNINVNDYSGFEAPLRMIPIQYLGLRKALEQGLNPDCPKNLSKSVIL